MEGQCPCTIVFGGKIITVGQGLTVNVFRMDIATLRGRVLSGSSPSGAVGLGSESKQIGRRIVDLGKQRQTLDHRSSALRWVLPCEIARGFQPLPHIVDHDPHGHMMSSLSEKRQASLPTVPGRRF